MIMHNENWKQEIMNTPDDDQVGDWVPFCADCHREHIGMCRGEATVYAVALGLGIIAMLAMFIWGPQ